MASGVAEQSHASCGIRAPMTQEHKAKDGGIVYHLGSHRDGERIRVPSLSQNIEKPWDTVKEGAREGYAERD